MYGKIFEQIFESTVNELALHVRFVWIALLVICNKDGVIDATPESIARKINLPIEHVLDAIGELTKPDLRSRSPQEDGRRLVPIRSSYGWRIVNYARYRAMQRQEDRRGYMREYMRDSRSADVNSTLASVNNCEPELGRLADSRGSKQEAKAKAKSKDGTQRPFDTDAEFAALIGTYPRPLGRKAARRHFDATVLTLDDLAAIKRALANYLASSDVSDGFIKHASTWFSNWRDYVNFEDKRNHGDGNGRRRQQVGALARSGSQAGEPRVPRFTPSRDDGNGNIQPAMRDGRPHMSDGNGGRR